MQSLVQEIEEATLQQEAQDGDVLIGEATPLIHEAFDHALDVRDAGDLRSAVRLAFAFASPGDTILLAPACASFDMFRDYAERGRVFKQEVLRLQEEWTTAREQ